MAAMNSLTIEIKGFERVMGNLRALAERSPGEFGQAAREEMDDAMMESQAECPYDYENPHPKDGTHLRDTAKVEGPIYDGTTVSILLSYNKYYAAIVHENPNVRHHWPTKWKYLEDPVNRRIPLMESRIMERIDMILSGQTMPLPFSAESLVQSDYSAWAYGTVGGRNTMMSWGRAWNSGNVYPLKVGKGE